MSYEQSKALSRRLQDSNFVRRYFVGEGLDIGSGNDPLEQYRELFPLMLSVRAWDKQDGDAQMLRGIHSETYNFVHASHILEHLVDPHAALTTWSRVTKRRGYLIITVPDEDLYEQGIFPSTWATEHLWTFTICKRKSWCNKSINLAEMIEHHCETLEPIKVEQLNSTYRYNAPRFDQTQSVSESAIEMVLRKR